MGEISMAYIIQHISWAQPIIPNKLNDGLIWRGTINSQSKDQIAQEHGQVMLECYIDPMLLVATSEANNRSPEDVFENEILPDAPHLKSGDFGEILCRSTLQEWRECPQFPLYRWRNRSTKNDTVRGADLIGYVKVTDTPNTNDLLVLCEVKTRSATTANTVVKDAYDGVAKDYVSRLASSLLFYQVHLRREGKLDEAQIYARFSNPHGQPYRRKLIAFIVHDEANWDNNFLNALPEQHGLEGVSEFDVVVLLVENLSGWIEQIRKSAVMSAVKCAHL